MAALHDLPINFFVGNHAPYVGAEDIFEYVFHGLHGIGREIVYSPNTYEVESINLVMENMKQTEGKRLAELRRANPNSRLYMIATELLTEQGFNSANLAQKKSGANVYENKDYWDERTKGFQLLAPYIDGLIFLAEPLVPSYQHLNIRSCLVPLVSLPNTRVIQRAPTSLRDIDIFFSGTLTEHRKTILEMLAQEGFNICTLSANVPDYMRRHLLSRSKLALGLRLGPDTLLMSKQRAHFYLEHRVPHLFEKTPDSTDLHPFIRFAEPGDKFIEECFELVHGIQEFSDQAFDEFRQCSTLQHEPVFREFLRFLEA